MVDLVKLFTHKEFCNLESILVRYYDLQHIGTQVASG
jgi:hypothetical protein